VSCRGPADTTNLSHKLPQNELGHGKIKGQGHLLNHVNNLESRFLIYRQQATATTSAMLYVITALHGMQTRSSDENSVCLSLCPSVRLSSVRPSVTRVDCDKTVERSVQIYIPYERSLSLVF